MTQKAQERLYNIQYLRGAAAFGVVLFHAGGFAKVPLQWGAFGVDLFFVISGFLMVCITDARSRPWPFLKDRLLRIAPLYWLATVAAFVLQGRDAARLDALFASLLFLPWGGEAPRYFPILNVGWTLNYEMLFYLLFACSLFLPRRLQLAGLAAAFLGLAMLWKTRIGGALPWAFWGHPIILEFLAGAVLGAAWRALGRWGLAGGFVLVVVASILLRQIGGIAVGLIYLWLAAGAVGGAVLLERARKPLRVPLLLGDASYSIYLWHYLAIAAVAPILGSRLAPGVQVAAYVVIGVAVGLAMHLAVERPLLKARSRLWKRGVPVPGGV